MMKKIYALSLMFVSVVSFGQASTGFTGTGSLNANGWVTHSGATPGQLSITAGSLTYTGLNSTGNKASLVAGNSEDVNLASAAPLTGTVYYSGIVNVLNTTGLNPNSSIGDYFMTIGSTAGANVTILMARLYVKAGSAENTFNLGVLNASGGTVAPTFASSDFAVGAPIFVVVKYEIASNSASLFINPTIGGTEGAATVTNATGTGTAPAQIASIALRQGGNATTGTGNIDVDEIRLGSTYEYVTAANLRVNQNQILGLQVYPNPVTNGILNIATDNNDTKDIAIFDVLGKQVVKATVTDGPVNVSALKTGVYVIKITEAGKTATRKLVIK